jgi:Flp pilus assembly protein TadB
MNLATTHEPMNVPDTHESEGATNRERSGTWWLWMLLPIACCGGPLIVAAVAAAGALAWGVLGAVIAAAVGVGVVVATRRRASRCCETRLDRDGSALRAPAEKGLRR